MKSIFYFIIIFLFLLSAGSANAEILFQEDFNDGDAAGWNVISGANLWKVENGRYGARIETPSTEIISVAGEISVSSYIIELDITPIAGADKNIVFRWKDYSALTNGPLYHYSAHFNDDSGGTLRLKKFGPTQNGWPVVVPTVLNHNQTYRIKVVLKNQKVEFYVDGVKRAEGIDLDYIHEGNERVMLYISTGGSFPTEVWFDNIVVKTIDEEPETDLDVPLLKQTSNPWQSQIYDSANLWNPTNPTINRWGCVITSIAMIFQYHGITKLPDGTPLNPGSINTWLKSQPDGYVGNGLVNWLAISRLSKLAKSSGNNPTFASDALEYTRFAGNNTGQLTEDITNNRPAILEQPGHFIVAKGISGNTFTINDPFYDRSTLNDGYNNSFLSLGQYRPSNTDLSYIMVTAPFGVNLELSDENGNVINDEFLQNPIIDPVSGLPSGPAINTLYLQQPLSGNYNIKISSQTQKPYTLTTYLYDANGDVKVFTNSGVLPANGSKILPVVFDKDNAANSSVKKDVTFQSIIDYINKAVSEGKIKKGAGKSLITLLKNAEKSYKSKKVSLAKTQLTAAEALLFAYKISKNVSSEAYSVISADLKELKASLK